MSKELRMKIIDLPFEIILIIQKYLLIDPDLVTLGDTRYKLDENWRNFMDISSSVWWKKLKYRTCHYHLNSLFSVEYAVNALYRAIIQSIIQDPFYQVSLYFDPDASLTPEQLLSINGVYSVDFSQNCNLLNVSTLNRVHSLFLADTNISYLEGLTSARFIDAFGTAVINVRPNALPKLHTLSLYGTSIFDVSSLSHLVNLDLSECLLVEDVSMLGKLHTLNLSNCPRVTDVTQLGNLYQLTLDYCEGISDVSALGNVKILSLQGCSHVTDVSALGCVENLNISRCVHVTDVSMLGHVLKLNLSHCTRICDVSALGAVRTLILRNCRGVKDVSMLGNVMELDLSCCKKLTGLENVMKVPNLTLF